MAVFVLFVGWLEFSKSCAFGAGAFGAGLAALANQQEQNLYHVLALANHDNKNHQQSARFPGFLPHGPALGGRMCNCMGHAMK